MTDHCAKAVLLAALAMLIAVLRPGTAAADGERVAIAASVAPGPAVLNQVWVRKYGGPEAGHVLLLIPGSPAGQANYDVLAPLFVQRVPNLAVWTLDRRENIGEDVSVMQIGDPNLSLLYYSGLVPVNGQFFTPSRAPRSFRARPSDRTSASGAPRSPSTTSGRWSWPPVRAGRAR